MSLFGRTPLGGVALCLAGLLIAGCQPMKKTPTNPALLIDPGPSPAVKFAINRISPAVVQINVVMQTFDNGIMHPEPAIGSGVIIDAAGRILTNFHVAGRAKQLEVTLADQEHVAARLLGSDHWTDLAVIQLDMNEVKQKALTFKWATLGNSDLIQLGQPVLAVGTPYGLTRTITKGIISNTDRFTDETTIDGYETGWFNNWIQTDAAINPGNSGGPLVNLRGEVIGINSKAVLSANNLGFAIPSNTARRVIAAILDHGKVNRSYIGIKLQPLQDLNTFYDVAANRGVLIRSVEPDSPASQAKIQPEDVLLAIDNTPVVARFPEQLASIRRLIAETPIGGTLALTFQRVTDGKAVEHIVTLHTEKLESVVAEQHVVAVLGVAVRDVTRAYLRNNRLPMVKGVIVTSIRDGSPAQDAKLQPDDIITRVNNRPVTDTDDLEAQINKLAKSTQTILIDVQRDRSVVTLAVKLND